MGLSFRKSIRLGKGVRLNFSKSGIGISAGVKGARVSIGPRGTRGTVSGGGFSYSTSLSGKKVRGKAAQTPQYQPPVRDLSAESMIAKSSSLIKFLWVTPFAFAFGWPWGLGAITLVLVAHFLSSQTKAFQLYQKSEAATDPALKVELVQNALDLYPCPAYDYAMAKALAGNDQLVEALPFVISTNKIKSSPTGLFIQAVCHSKVEQYKEAIDVLLQIDEKHEYDEYLEAVLLKAECYYFLKAYDQCLEAVAELTRTKSAETINLRREARIYKALVMFKTEDEKKGIKELQKLVAEAPGLTRAESILDELKEAS